jgi:geranylgeranyl pyrophosphate synthase
MKKPRELTTDEDVNWVISLYTKYDVIKWCQNYANNLVKEAQQLLDEMPFERKEALKDIFRYMSERLV